MSDIIWSSKDMKEVGLKAVTKVVGTIEAQPKFGTWDKGGDYIEFTLVDAEVIESESPVILKDDIFNFRVNYKPGKNSKWDKFIVKPFEKLGIELPGGLIGKRVTFERKTISYGEVKAGKEFGDFKAGDKIESTEYTPVEIEGGAADAKDYMAMALELANGKTEAQFKTAILTDATLRKVPEIKDGAKSGALVKGWVKAKAATIDAKGVIKVS